MFSANLKHGTAAGGAGLSWHALAIITVALMLLPLAGCSGASVNAPAATTAAASTSAVSSNPAVEQTLETSCFDCHSDRGAVSWNARLAPSYLFGAGDARRSLNFSEWSSYSAKHRKAEMAAITRVIKDDAMPPWDYDLLHPAAKPSAGQRQQLLQWAEAAPGTSRQ